jgi:hypothetical protein
VFSPGLSSSGITLDDDLCGATSNRGSTCLAVGSRGFSRGVHYWEVHVEAQRDQGGIFIGVAEHGSHYDTWRDYGFVSYSAVQSSRGGERLFGPFYFENDYIGVLLNMDEGYIAFVKDAEMFGEHKVELLGTAFDHVRSGSKGGPKSRLLFPAIGLRNHSGNRVSIKNCKWLSRPGQQARAALRDILEAATLLRRWDRPSSVPVDVPLRVLQEAHTTLKKSAKRRTILCETRSGVLVEFDRSAAACAALLETDMLERPVRGGTRIRTTRGEGTIIGVHRGRLWYKVDSDTGAWYWNKGEFEEMIGNGMGGLLEETDQERQDAEAEASDAGHAVGEEALSFSDFCGLVSGPEWTLEADADLVRLVNTQCDTYGVSPLQLSLQSPGDDERFPVWFYGDENRTKLRARFAVLLGLNRRLQQLLPLIDLTVVKPSVIVPDTETIVYPSALGQRMSTLRSLAFTRTKTSFWNTVLAATVFKTQQSQGETAWAVVFAWGLQHVFVDNCRSV